MENILKGIETEYPVNTILVNGEQVWPYLRIAYNFAYTDKIASEKAKKQLAPPLFQRLKEMPKNSFYGSVLGPLADLGLTLARSQSMEQTKPCGVVDRP